MPTTAMMIEALIAMRHRPGGIPEERFWQWVERFRADLVHQALSILHDQEDAEDVAQDSLCEAYEGLHTLRDPSKLGNWLRQVNRRNALDRLRRRKTAREQRLHTGELDEVRAVAGLPRMKRSTPPGAPAALGAEEVLGAVERLPAPFRETVILRYMEGLDVEQIARCLDVPEGTVRSRLCRADRMLIRRLGLLRGAAPDPEPGEETDA
ncbi:MAG: RNA polymerase sigma factor [Planctomycetota bacterium]|nr:RNA polymerase sigma factor [Planctomycetota bacterium]